MPKVSGRNNTVQNVVVKVEAPREKKKKSKKKGRKSGKRVGGGGAVAARPFSYMDVYRGGGGGAASATAPVTINNNTFSQPDSSMRDLITKFNDNITILQQPREVQVPIYIPYHNPYQPPMGAEPMDTSGSPMQMPTAMPDAFSEPMDTDPFQPPEVSQYNGPADSSGMSGGGGVAIPNPKGKSSAVSSPYLPQENGPSDSGMSGGGVGVPIKVSSGAASIPGVSEGSSGPGPSNRAPSPETMDEEPIFSPPTSQAPPYVPRPPPSSEGGAGAIPIRREASPEESSGTSPMPAQAPAPAPSVPLTYRDAMKELFGSQDTARIQTNAQDVARQLEAEQIRLNAQRVADELFPPPPPPPPVAAAIPTMPEPQAEPERSVSTAVRPRTPSLKEPAAKVPKINEEGSVGTPMPNLSEDEGETGGDIYANLSSYDVFSDFFANPQAFDAVTIYERMNGRGRNRKEDLAVIKRYVQDNYPQLMEQYYKKGKATKRAPGTRITTYIKDIIEESRKGGGADPSSSGPKTPSR